MKIRSILSLGWSSGAGVFSWIAAASLLLAVPAGSMATPASTRTSQEAASVKAAPPFARVYLAVRGCMSCSHCRTSIRQMVRSNAGGGEARLGDDQIEVRYATPRTVPLREVIRSLAENRLHDLSLVDVLFEARGTIGLAKDGTATFALAETGQSFPLVIEPSLSPTPSGTQVRLTAVVDGWRKKGALSLSAREIRPGG
jgi:hypothetical protein